MKKLIFLLLTITYSLFPQSWNNVIQTSIPYNDGTGTGIDQFTNKDGINVLVDYHAYNYPNHIYYLKYYLLNSSGSIIRTYTFENQEVEFASVDGNNDKTYVVYKLGNQIKTRKSTNAGQNWTSLADFSIGSNTCNNIDVVFSNNDNALHVVWATQDASSDYKTYYKRLASNDIWGSQENVTDGSLIGGFPTVSTSTNRVHVSYNTGHSSDPATNIGDAKSRDKYVNTWQTSQLVYSPQSFRERIHAGNSKLFDFYYKLESGLGQYTSVLYVKNRDFGSSTWSSPIQLNYGADVYNIVSATNTSDGKTHIVYSDDGIFYRSYDGTNWSSEYAVGSESSSPKVSANSNDLYVVWGGFIDDYVYFRHYDVAPLAPINPQLSSNPGNGMVRFSWTKNNEPDISLYEVWRKVHETGDIWQSIGTTTNTYFVDPNYWYAPGAGNFLLTYKVRAKDIGNNYSLYSSEVSTRGEELGKQLFVENSQLDFRLQQNHPNPFNPSTKISYSIKEEGLVTLKIYDILGKEIATLVNENKPIGNYEVDFNASQLPSGMYIYKIQTGIFNDAKKMLLTK